MVTTDIILRLSGFFLGLGWLLYFRENRRKRDAYTDLCQLIHDHNLTMDDIRRTRDHTQIRNMVKRTQGTLTAEDVARESSFWMFRTRATNRESRVFIGSVTRRTEDESDPFRNWGGIQSSDEPEPGDVDGLYCDFCSADGFDTQDELDEHIDDHPWTVRREGEDT